MQGTEPRIPDDAVAGALSTDDFIRSCDEAFRLYGSGEMKNPARTESVTREGRVDVFRLELPAEWVSRYVGRKVIEERSDVATGRLGDRTATIELEDLETGRYAVLDAETITNVRTGAAGALTVRYLGPPAVRSAAVLGTGRIARAVAICLDAVVSPGEIRVTSRTRKSREAFRNAVERSIGATLILCDSIADCVKDADVVLTAVPTADPVLALGDLEDGVMVCAVAGDPRTKQLAMDLMCGRPVVVDHVDQARSSGDFAAAAAEGRLDDIRLERAEGGRVMTIGDAALGRLGRLMGSGAICYLTGMAIQDLHAAVTVMERMPERWREGPGR